MNDILRATIWGLQDGYTHPFTGPMRLVWLDDDDLANRIYMPMQRLGSWIGRNLTPPTPRI